MIATLALLFSVLALGGDVVPQPPTGQPPTGQPPVGPQPEAKPPEAKPAEAKPAEAKPAEAKPAEAKPAEAVAKVTGKKSPLRHSAPGPSADYVSHNCGERLVLCVEPTGKLFDIDQKETLRVGERVHVIVIGQREDGMTISIEVSSAKSENTLFDPRAATKAMASPLVKLAERLIEVPDADTITVHIVKKNSEGSSIGSLTLEIQDTLYFARAGLAFTWVGHGSRTITAEHSIIEKTEFFPGVALTIWPWGHRAKTLSPFEKGISGRAIGDLIGLQIGTDFDFSTPFDRTFIGVTLEPISGLGVSGGVAMLTGQFFSGTPSGSAMAVSDKYMWRPYVSLTLTSELLDTLSKLAGKAKEQPE